MSWMRRNAKWIMVTTIGLFILGFIALPAVRYLFSPSSERYLGTIEDERIEMNRYLEMVDQERNQYLETNDPPLSEKERNKIRQNALKKLTNQTLMQDFAQAEGGKATSDEIRQYFSQQFRNQQGQINQSQVNRYLRNLPDKKRKEISENSRQQIETFRTIQWIQNQLNLGDTEFEMVLQGGLREVDLYGIYKNPRNLIDEQKIESFYETNQDQFMSKSKVLLREIELHMPDTAPQSQNNSLSSLKNTIETIRRRHTAGDSFATLAREYSNDTETASEGGLRGWVNPEDLSEELSRVAFAADTGTISNLVRTPGKLHLLYVEKGPIREPKPLGTVRSQIQDRLLSDTHWTQAQNQIKKIKTQLSNTKQKFESLKEFAFLKSHSKFSSAREGSYGWVPVRYVVEGMHVNSNKWVGELSTNQIIYDEISHALASLKPEGISDPIKSKVGYHIFYINQTRAARLTELAETTRSRLRRTIATSKNNDLVDKWLKKKRRNVSINLEVPKSRVGGKIPWKKK